MNDILDLDILSPEVKKVKLNDVIIDVYPIRVNDIVKIQKLDRDDIGAVIDVLKGIIPKIEEANPTLDQLSRLMEFVTNSDKKKE